jgi:putative ABC transport system permease protein
MAKKYFGTDDAVGKIMQLKVDEEFENFTVTAITRKFPADSTLEVEMLLPFKFWSITYNKGWFGGSLNTFLLLEPQANLQLVEKKMQSFV